MAEILIANDKNIKIAAQRLKSGELVAFATESVYGLGADATNDAAVKEIFKVKNRPDFNPLILHVSDLEMARQFAKVNSKAKALAENLWPAALSFILPLKENSEISKYVSGGLKTVAIRAPAHPSAQMLIKELDRPIAAPSANLSGSLSPTTPKHVNDSIGGKINTILAGGKSKIGLESTIVDLSQDIPTILRAGFILPETIADILDEEVKLAINTGNNDDIKCPGQLLKHYAPSKPLRLQAVDIEEDEALLAFGSTKFMGIKNKGNIPPEQMLNLSPEGDLSEAASNLFYMLHELDNSNFAKIAVMDIPNIGIGIAINDRLKRAAKGT